MRKEKVQAKTEPKPLAVSISARYEKAQERLGIAKKELDEAIAELKASRIILLAELRECPDGVTRREREILDAVRAGKFNKEIGWDLHVSERTVKFHVSSLLKKFNVSTRREL
jgi:DNA-binding NarL/FixJ family response regulator